MNSLEFRPIFGENFAPDLFDWCDKLGEHARPCQQCTGTGQDPEDGHHGCSGCRGSGYIEQQPPQVCQRVTSGLATLEAWYCEDLKRVIIRGRPPFCLDENREDAEDLIARAFRVAGLTASGLVVRTAGSEAQAIRKAVEYCDRYRDAWRAVSPAPAEDENRIRVPGEDTAEPERADKPAQDTLHVEPEARTPTSLADALAYCLGPEQAAPPGFVNDHADLLAFGDAREDQDPEKADQHYTRLRESLMVTHADHDQARDMLEDLRALVATVAESLGVKAEPHQTYNDRLLSAAQDMADAYWNLRQARAAAALPVERLIDKAHGGRGHAALPGWVLELVRDVFQAASAAVHCNHERLGLVPEPGEEIHVNVAGADVYTLPLQLSGMERPRFVVHVPAEGAQVATVAYNLGPEAHEGAIREKLEEMGWMPPEQAAHAMLNPPAFFLGEFSGCGPEGGEPVEGRLVHNPGDPSVGIPEAWELDGGCQLARYIQDLEVKAEAGAQAYLALIPAWHEPPQRMVAPWRDMHGRTIREGDTIRHPDGQEGRVIYRPEREDDADRWLVDYGDGTESRLVLQINDRGQAVVVQT